MDDNSASPRYDEFASAYEQAAQDHDWLAELSEEWISNASSTEPSEQGSGRGTSIRSTFGTGARKIDTIPEESTENSASNTVRIALGDLDVQNTPEWKRRLDEAKMARDLLTSCNNLESLFKEDTTKSTKVPSLPVSPEVRTASIRGSPMTNTASFLKDITDNISIGSSKKLQSSPLRQVIDLDDASSSPEMPQVRPITGGSMASSGKSTIRSSDQKSTHESSDEDSSFGDSNEDLSIAEPTQTLMDPSYFTARPGSDEMSVRSPPEYDSPEESFRTAKVMQTPHPNATNSLASSTEMKSRSVRFATPHTVDEHSFSFNFTPNGPVEASHEFSQPQIESSVDMERPRTPTPQQSSAKSSPRKSPNSPLKLFTAKYDTFTNNKMQEMVSNLLPKPDEDDDLTSSRQRKRARREALSRDRVPRVPQSHEIRHNRMPSLTTQEMFDDAEDFMRDLRSMPRPVSTEKLRENEVEVAEETNEDLEPTSREEIQFHEDDEYDEGESSEFEDNPLPSHHHQRLEEYSQHSSEAYDSIRQVVSPGKLSVFPLSPTKAAQLSQPLVHPSSRVSSAESMQVITPDDVSHLLPTTVGSMTFDAAKKAWFKIRPSQMQQRPQPHQQEEEDSLPLPPDMNDELLDEEEEEEEDIFRDIDDLVVSDEEEEENYESRPTSSASAAAAAAQQKMVQQGQEVDETYVSEVEDDRMSPGGKERGSAQEYPEQQQQQYPEQRYPEQKYEEDEEEEEKDITEAPLTLSDLQPSPAPPPKSPLRKSISISPMPSPLNSPTKSQRSQRNLPPSPLRKPLQVSVQDHENITVPIPSPMRSHRKTLSSEKRGMRKSIPLPDPNTPEAIRLQSQIKASPSKPTTNLRKSQYEHLMKTPQTQRLDEIPQDSPFLIPRDIIRLSISPPPADISFANTPRGDISFSVTTKMLVKHLTDFEPFEPYWENLRYIDLRGKGVTSLDGLKSFCPKVEEIDIKDCKVKYLTGLPSTMKILKASGNRLDGLVSFAWAKNLQYLDLANNEIDSLAGLSTLIHLRELRVDNNLLTNLDGILQLDGLLKVSAKQNQVSSLDFTGSRLPRLEILECQRNCIGWVESLEGLTSLMSLHLDDNNLTMLQPRQPMRSLRTLKLCRNELEVFDPKFYPELRTLYLDENQIQSFSGVRRLRLLENFSARSQKGKTNINIHGLSELRKIYLSGIPISLRLERPFYNLQYLELAATKLTALPKDFASKVPNVRILNLSFNSLKDISPLKGLSLLKRLFLIGNRISSLGESTETFLSLTELQVLDLRLNPITLSFYPPVEAKKSDHHKDMFSLVTGKNATSSWTARDKQFRAGMPRSWELRRKAYHGLVYTACPRLRWFDGSEVSRGAVAEGERVLKSLEGVVGSVKQSKKENRQR